MTNKSALGILVVPSFILLVPLVAMQFTDEVAWDYADFILAWFLMSGVGLAYRLATRRAESFIYRAAVGLGLATAFVLTWANLAVGVIGSEDNPANLLYFGVLLVGITGAVIARLESRGMAVALFAVAIAQASVPVIALVIWRPDFSPGVMKVFILNAVFVLLFLGSALLFRHAAGNASSVDRAHPGE